MYYLSLYWQLCNTFRSSPNATYIAAENKHFWTQLTPQIMHQNLAIILRQFCYGKTVLYYWSQIFPSRRSKLCFLHQRTTRRTSLEYLQLRDCSNSFQTFSDLFCLDFFLVRRNKRTNDRKTTNSNFSGKSFGNFWSFFNASRESFLSVD